MTWFNFKPGIKWLNEIGPLSLSYPSSPVIIMLGVKKAVEHDATMNTAVGLAVAYHASCQCDGGV